MYVYVLNKYNILPNGINRPLGKLNTLKKQETMQKSPSEKKISTFRRFKMYAKSLPKRIVISYLYSRTPFWGDGLIVEAQID
jgi:hypothetical protein